MASRADLFSFINNMQQHNKLSVVEIIQQAYADNAQKQWENTLASMPHGREWHTSFHASSFPGDNPKSCPRSSLYNMMGVPPDTPHNFYSVAIMDLGKSIETHIVTQLHDAGVLLSNPPDADTQTAFSDDESWLTGSCDAVIDLNGRPHVLEIKTKSEEHMQSMKKQMVTYDDQHKRQLLTYVSMFNSVSGELWPDMETLVDGTLLYVSRGNTTNMVGFTFGVDDEFYAAGRNKLMEWKDMFINSVLPERPKEWRWTEQPCKWCKYKKETCKPDFKNAVNSLRDSYGVLWAKKVYSSYNYDVAHEKVLRSWNVESTT